MADLDPRERDVLDALDDLRQPDHVWPALDAASVRGLGDRRRRRRQAAAGGLVAVVAAAAVGSAVLLTGSDEAAPLPATSPSATATPSPSPSAAPSTPTPSPSESPTEAEPSETTTIADDIPLAVGYPDINEDGTEVVVERGPGEGVMVCDQRILTGGDAASVASVRFLGGEDFRSRTLMVFGDVAEAEAAMDWTARTVDACAGSPEGEAVTVLGAVEGADSLLWSKAYAMGEGGPAIATDLFRLVRVGNAVLLDTTGGEASGPATSKDDEQVTSTRNAVAPVVEAMAVYEEG
ncbi:hypothetical protein JQN72_01350 [Phycicoccus sp. CSK15P-2]|uniref:hypothetical protein n=1 Tax=Phycicoccus sp. CSK15P-2 TaxID=2807627 RepID=UPI001951C309|nr:hypothetical protein [Phycicoccus sp. CSK15P-2]MBM6402892.1 hypothetical protein [Phycicoccus sp. CSK15P-2]